MMTAPASAPSAPPGRGVGTLTWYSAGVTGSRPMWGIRALPHVMIRVKRLFPRLRTADRGLVLLVDTPEVAYDIDWLCRRHPLTMTDAVAARLAAAVGQYRDRTTAIDDIMAGRRTLDLALQPARTLRDYQAQFVTLARTTKRMILGDELGLGKTTEAAGLLGDPAALPALVVCPPHLTRQWVAELAAMWPQLRTHVAAKRAAYDLRAARGSHGELPDVLIVSYAKLAGWSDACAGQFPTVIFDEVHELRAGTETHKGAAAAHLAAEATTVVGLTATAVCNYGDEIHQLYDILAPDVLGSRAEFLREWGGGMVGSHHKVDDPAALGSYLRDQGLFLRRTRKDVGRELPPVLRIRHEVDSDPSEIDYVTDDIAAMAHLVLDRTADRDRRFVVAGQLDMRLRQATGLAKAPYVGEFVKMLLASEPRVLLLGWHRLVYETWLTKLRAFHPVLYTGSESPAQKQRAVDAFLHGPSRVMLMSLRSGVGLDGLQAGCRAVVFGELDWSPAIHDQIIGRLHRDGQDSEVSAYFLVSETGADPVLDEVLQLKRGQGVPIVDPDAPLFEPVSDKAMQRVELLARAVLAQHQARRGDVA